MNYLFVDYETRSFCDLKTKGAWVYSEDPTTEIICMAYRLNDGPTKIWLPGYPTPGEFFETNKFVARNALFEIAITKNVLVNTGGFPESIFLSKNWICTRNICLSVGLPGSLEDSANFINSKEKKMDLGKSLITKYCKPAKKKDGSLYFRELVGEDYDNMLEYCRQDVITDSEIFFRLKNLPEVDLERSVVELDFKQNVQGLPVDKESLIRVKRQLDKDKEQAEKEMEEIGVNVRSPKQMIEEFNKYGYNIDNTQKGTIEKLLKVVKEPHLLKLLELRQRLGKASIKKYDALLNMTAEDGTFKHGIKYFGAHTGRYSGQGFQPHNMPKTKTNSGEIDMLIENIDNSRDLLKDAQKILPGLIKAPEGMTFLMGDFAAIEARVLAFIAGQNNLVEDFRNDRDIYTEMAIDVVRKPERQLGKAIILGSGYGMGHNTFKSTCASCGMNISTELAEKSVKTYRSKYPKIPKLWYDVQDAFTSAFFNKNTAYKVGKYIKIISPANYVMVILPSGRAIYYHKVKIGSDIKFMRGNTEIYLYGGKLVENIVQAIARDILVDRMLECEETGLNPVLHVHDEIVNLVSEENIKENSNLFFNIMNKEPEWFKGFPLATEIEVSKRYHK